MYMKDGVFPEGSMAPNLEGEENTCQYNFKQTPNLC